MKRLIGQLLKYALGVFAWMALISFMNISAYIDGLWTKDIKLHLVRNVLGKIGFRADSCNSGKKYIFCASLYKDDEVDAENRKMASLDSLIEVENWREFGSEGTPTTTTFVDSKHKYILYDNSDGVHMAVFPRR